MLTRILIKTLLSAILTVPVIAPAETELGAHKNIKGAIRPDPSFVSGQPVLFFSVSKYALTAIGVKLAYSLYNADGEPVIFYDEESLSKLPQNFQRWILAHELEHFNLGHFDIQNVLYLKSLGFDGSQNSFEKAADCAAVKILQDKYFLTREEIVNIAQTVQAVFYDSPLQRTSLTPLHGYSHQFRYTDSAKRAKNIIDCYEKS